MSEFKRAVCDFSWHVLVRIGGGEVGMDIPNAEALLSDLTAAINEAKHDPIEEFIKEFWRNQYICVGADEAARVCVGWDFIRKECARKLIQEWEAWRKEKA